MEGPDVKSLGARSRGQGLLAAAHKGLDALSVAIAGMAAFGGGTLHDVRVDRWPFF